MDNPPPHLAPVVPLIKRCDLDHYRFLAHTADPETLRTLAFVMIRDLEEVLGSEEQVNDSSSMPSG